MGFTVPADARIRLKRLNRNWVCVACGSTGGRPTLESITHQQARLKGFARMGSTANYVATLSVDGCPQCETESAFTTLSQPKIMFNFSDSADKRVTPKQVNQTWCCGCKAGGGEVDSARITHAQAVELGLTRVKGTKNYTIHHDYQSCDSCSNEPFDD